MARDVAGAHDTGRPSSFPFRVAGLTASTLGLRFDLHRRFQLDLRAFVVRNR